MANGTVEISGDGTVWGDGIKDRLLPKWSRIEDSLIGGSGIKTERRPKVYVGDIGTFLCLYTGMDLGIGDVSLAVLKPDGSEVSWSGEVLDVMTFKRVVESGDLDQDGIYKMQVVVNAPDSYSKFHGETVELEVFDEFY